LAAESAKGIPTVHGKPLWVWENPTTRPPPHWLDLPSPSETIVGGSGVPNNRKKILNIKY